MRRSFFLQPALAILLLAAGATACASPVRPGALPATPTVDFAALPDAEMNTPGLWIG